LNGCVATVTLSAGKIGRRPLGDEDGELLGQRRIRIEGVPHLSLARHGRPDRVVIDGSQTNQEAIISCDTTNRLQDSSRHRLKPIRIRRVNILNNRIEQDHRRIKRRIRPMLGLKSAAIILEGIEMVHMTATRLRSACDCGTAACDR
jgi:transposase-like protein